MLAHLAFINFPAIDVTSPGCIPQRQLALGFVLLVYMSIKKLHLHADFLSFA